ncbi:MAG: radical SAM protein [Candidatus Tritonobacter lacicola]|nr:radical SAM protein [Candidatus Tritonobacter lacicola]
MGNQQLINGVDTKVSYRTLSGGEITPLKKGLPKTIQSICPECMNVIDAELYPEDGKVMMRKSCPSHGSWTDIYWGDVDLYLRAEKWYFHDGKGLSNPQTESTGNCPFECGLCNIHTSHTGLGNIDLTNRCNLTCPICFANANVTKYVYEPTLDQVRDMLMAYRRCLPVPGRIIQFSGGEPTLSPIFLDSLSLARELGFTHIQVASNGLKFADEGFAHAAAEAGLHTIYLQFDGLSDDIYKVTRGRAVLDEKLRAIENIRRAGMKLVFVVTVVKGLNDRHVGEILKFAIENVDVIAGISFQPVCFTGRISREERMAKRITLPDVMKGLCEQTGITRPTDFYPVCCSVPFSKMFGAIRGEANIEFTCHPHCTLCTYLVVDPHGRAHCFSRFLDMDDFFHALYRLADKLKKSRLKSLAKVKTFYALKKFWHQERAPEGLTFEKFAHTLSGIVDKSVGRGEGEKKTYKTLMVGGMHFMDAYNYDLDRIKRCVIHFATPEGKLISFCSYNSGPTYRTATERRFSVPLDEWRKKQGEAGE